MADAIGVFCVRSSMRSELLLPALCTSVSLTTAGGGATARTTTKTQAPASSAILIDGNVVSNNLAFGSNNGYLSVKAGTRQISLRPSGTISITTPINISRSSSNTFVIGGWGAFDGCCGGNDWLQDETTPASSKLKLRIWDAAVTDPALDTYVLPQGGTPNGTPTIASRDLDSFPGTYLERVSKIPPKRDPETGKIEERVVDGE
jgi:Domain of unknown function (DUF4397)